VSRNTHPELGLNSSPWISSDGVIAHPNSPRGGCGPGGSRVPIILGARGNNSQLIPHPQAPASRHRLSKPEEHVILLADNSPAFKSKAFGADLYITVTSPSQIGTEKIFEKDPMLAPSSGISFQLSRHGKLRQDEYVTGILQWEPRGSKLSEAKKLEEFSTFSHRWDSETKRTRLPETPIMLKDEDTHVYGLAVSPGLWCEESAKKRTPPFDRNRDDWRFTELGQFVDTVTFPDKEIKRVYLFEYRCVKIGLLQRQVSNIPM
jgi:hypothetical protein